MTLTYAPPASGGPEDRPEAGAALPGHAAAGPTADHARPVHPTSGTGLPHRVALDGLRGAAVAAVVAYHLGWAPGGFLGVSLFFTLSGFLITNLLLAERSHRGDIRLGRFWARRARRLLPAALAGIGLAVAVTAAVGTPEQLRALPGDVLGALFYAANWHFIAAHRAYSAGFAAPSPLLHYWSLAIEEQLYLVVPLVVVASARAGGRRYLRYAVGALLAVSMAATVRLWNHTDPNRAYFGTDTRMFELFLGVGLAAVVGFPGRTHRGARTWRRLGLLAGPVTVAGWAVIHETDGWLYHGGLWLVAGLSTVLILAACADRGVATVLRWRPLVGLGRISYGIYVYHWPLFLWLDHAHTGLAGVDLAAVRIGATLALAGASYRWLEQPVRQRRWRLPRPTLVLAPVLAGALVAAALASAGLATARSVARPRSLLVRTAAATGTATGPGPARSRPGGAAIDLNRASTLTPAADRPALPPLRRVLFVGDSLVHQALPTFADRFRSQGVTVEGLGGFGQSLMSEKARWLPEIAQAVATFDPDVVVMESCCGQFKGDPTWVGPNGTAVPDSPGFYAEWRRLALQASIEASARGALVAWVLAPPTRTNGWYGPIDGRVPIVNRVYQSLAACGPAAGFIDWTVLANPDGSFAWTLPDPAGDPVRIRNADGFHFTPDGIAAQADVTVPAVERQWAAARGRPGPWQGPCTTDAPPAIAPRAS